MLKHCSKKEHKISLPEPKATLEHRPSVLWREEALVETPDHMSDPVLPIISVSVLQLLPPVLGRLHMFLKES